MTKFGYTEGVSLKDRECDHCWHMFTGAIWKVMRNGFVIQECCKCGAHREVHRGHLHDDHSKFRCAV